MKNCSPTIKRNAIIYIAKYISQEQTSNLNIYHLNKKNIETIVDNYILNENIPLHISNKLKIYILKNIELIENKIQQLYDTKQALDINNRYCTICKEYFDTQEQLKNHEISINHLRQENIFIKNINTFLEKDNIKNKQLKDQIEKKYNKLYTDYIKLQTEYNYLL